MKVVVIHTVGASFSELHTERGTTGLTDLDRQEW